MEAANNDDNGNDLAAALNKARKQAQINATKDKQAKPAKKGAILHVNNYRSAVPEGTYNPSKNPNFPQMIKNGYMIKTKPAPNSTELMFVVEAKLSTRMYMVKNTKTDKYFAMKIEPFHNSGSVKQLRRDVFILIDTIKQDSRFSNHFLKIVSKGRIPEKFNYVIATLCDYNLNDLREKVIKGDFSTQTAARLAMQAFQAVHDLHTLGYLHRNISPAAFMLGLENNAVIYLGSLSTGYRFKQKDGKESSSPKKLYRMQKLRYLPRVYHRYKEMNRFDDLESWLYTAIDFFGQKLLPWFDSMDESQMVANKERFFFDAFEEIYTYVPKQLQVLQRYIDKNNDDDKPNYTFMGITLVGMRDKLKFAYQGPFDFQGGPSTVPTKSAKVTKAKKKAAPQMPQDVERYPEAGSESLGQGGPVICANSSQVRKPKKKREKESTLAQNKGDEEQVFEDGEAEQQNPEAAPNLQPDRMLSLVRRKTAPKPPALGSAEDIPAAPLKPVKPEVVKKLKKKKQAPAPPPEEGDEDEEGEEPPPPPPPPKTPKKGKKKKKAAASGVASAQGKPDAAAPTPEPPVQKQEVIAAKPQPPQRPEPPPPAPVEAPEQPKPEPPVPPQAKPTPKAPQAPENEAGDDEKDEGGEEKDAADGSKMNPPDEK